MKTLAVIALLLTPTCLLAETLVGEVISIADGDTLTILVNRSKVKVRLAEIDTPERSQPWGARAKQALADRVSRKVVSVTVSDTDRYGRAIGRIWLDGRDINRELVANGHAWVYRRYMRDTTLLEDESKAREAGLGLWSLPGPISPWEWRRGARSNPAVNGARDGKCGSKRYCRQMSSCEEARFYLNTCGLTRLDGDSDGVPCESICG